MHKNDRRSPSKRLKCSRKDGKKKQNFDEYLDTKNHTSLEQLSDQGCTARCFGSKSSPGQKSKGRAWGGGGGDDDDDEDDDNGSNDGNAASFLRASPSPLEFPATPELILEHHRRHPFLTPTEEWIIIELNEYECLVDSLEVVRIVADHSKFFEVDPEELWQEFFEFVADSCCYDNVINEDLWQEFRDKKYSL